MAVDLQSSRTALLSAAARAAHLTVDDEPFLFRDTVAERVLGSTGVEMIRYHRQRGGHPIPANTRVTATVRSRFAETALREAVDRGVDQYLLVGGGARHVRRARSELARGLLVVEVDHPGTQRWKRQRLSESGVDVPGTVRYAELDLTLDSVFDRAVEAGLDPSRPVFVSWLGGVPYFGRSELDRILADLARTCPGSELVADYHVPPRGRDTRDELYVRAVSVVASEGGEPWRSTFPPDGVVPLLGSHGFAVVADHSERAAVPADLWERRDELVPGGLVRLVHARRGVDR